MGRNNQQRRAAKAKERARRHAAHGGSAFGGPPVGEWAAGIFAGSMGARDPHDRERRELDLGLTFLRRALRLDAEGQHERAEEAWFDVEATLASPTGRRALVGHLNLALAGMVESLWRGGWQPADLVRVASRDLRPTGAAVVGDAIARQLSTYAVSTVAPSWHEQLAQAEVSTWWPRESDPLTARARIDDRGWRGLLAGAMSALDRLADLPQLQVIDPLPGTWRPSRARAARAVEPLDGRLLDRVRALLAKAENTPYEAEADTFTAAAQKLMARHSIDRAMLAATSIGGASAPSARRVGIERPYEAPKVLLLDVVASANRCRTVWSKGFGFVTVVGFDDDIDATETIFTSLLVQSTHAMSGHGSRATRAGQSRTTAFRKSFLTAFAHRIGQRLAEVTQEETSAATREEAQASRGSAGPSRALVQVLAERDSEVDARVESLFPGMVTRSAGSVTDAEGWSAGLAAADDATLFDGQPLSG
ncbi:DUF2786 domain-containing protein [Dermatophilaceae bacterium Soc4.6]